MEIPHKIRGAEYKAVLEPDGKLRIVYRDKDRAHYPYFLQWVHVGTVDHIKNVKKYLELHTDKNGNHSIKPIFD